jgi:hypothetical protein
MRSIIKWVYAALMGALVGGFAHANTYDVAFSSNGSFELKQDKIPSGSFQDVYRFSLAAPSALTVSFKDNSQVLADVSVIADGAVEFGPISYAATGKPSVETFSLQEPGSYEIRLNGTADKNGKYTIRLTQATLAPPGSVPEPAEWTMLIAGFVVIGFIARRRNRNF